MSQVQKISPKRRHLWLYIIAAVASLGGLLSGFDTGVISGALLFINDTWPLDSLTKGWVVSSALVGAVLGAAANGILADIYGRKKIIIATAVIFALGSILCGFATSVSWLIAGRMILGLAIGMVNFVVPLYLSEISPQKIRGMLVSLYQLAITAGILFSYLINRLFALSEYNWRWMLGCGLIPALILIIGISFLGDTPRWLISKKREDEAKHIFKKISPEIDIDRHIADIKSSMETPDNAKKTASNFQPWMLTPLLIGIGMMFMQICTGINTIIYYTATIFTAAGFTDTLSALYATIGVGFVNFFMTFVAILFTDKLGRKPLLYAGLSGMTASLLILGGSFYLTDILGPNLKWIAVGSVVIYIACFAFSLGPIGWIIISEIMPLKIRGLAMSICTMANFGFNFLIALTFPVLIEHIGEAYTFWIFGIVGIFSLWFTFRYIPETKGRSLEQIEHHWKHMAK
ncbi:MAG: sugar porter family MFS transporter [Alphaproteobacteria bacterium]|nr:sugar porter family MFS transporter [Alphaproteobacteria bacterium]